MDFDAYIGQVRPSLIKASKALFGKQHRLELAAVCGALQPPLWSRGMSRLLDLPENQVAAELNTFVQLEALSHLSLSEFDRRKTYEPVAHPLWEYSRREFERAICRAFGDEAEEISRGYWQQVAGEPAPRITVSESDWP